MPETLKQTLEGIDNGTIGLTIVKAPDWCNYPEYRSENGWTFCVFDDCGEWDYIEWFVDPSGRRRDFPVEEVEEDDEEGLYLQRWSPNNHAPWGYEEISNA